MDEYVIIKTIERLRSAEKERAGLSTETARLKVTAEVKEAKEALAKLVSDVLTDIARTQRRPKNDELQREGLQRSDASDLRQAALVKLAENDFRELLELDLSNDAGVVAFFRKLLRNQNIDAHRKRTAVRRNESTTATAGDDAPGLLDRRATTPQTAASRTEALARFWELWRAAKDRLHEQNELSAADLQLIKLVEVDWDRAGNRNWRDIAARLGGTSAPPTLRDRAGEIVEMILDEFEGGRGYAHGLLSRGGDEVA